jgi:hypothetical protein
LSRSEPLVVTEDLQPGRTIGSVTVEIPFA